MLADARMLFLTEGLAVPYAHMVLDVVTTMLHEAKALLPADADVPWTALFDYLEHAVRQDLLPRTFGPSELRADHNALDAMLQAYLVATSPARADVLLETSAFALKDLFGEEALDYELYDALLCAAAQVM
jgi:hypothetical protein